MNRHGQYANVSGVFAIEAGAESDHTDETATAADSLAQTATANGVQSSILTSLGKHDWQFGEAVFEQTLPWLAGELGTPETPRIAMPGVLPLAQKPPQP